MLVIVFPSIGCLFTFPVLEQVGVYLSGIVGSVGVVAQVAGGTAADCMYARTSDLRWYAWVPALTSSIATPFAIACYSATSDVTSLVLFIVPTLAANCFDAPVQHSPPFSQRALARVVLESFDAHTCTVRYIACRQARC